MGKDKRIKDYIISKYGLYNKRLTIRDNLVHSLNEENNGRTHDLLPFVHEVKINNYLINQITIPNMEHYNYIESRTPLKNNQPIIGVAIKYNNKLILIDGYHRIKYLNENDIISGDFIIMY